MLDYKLWLDNSEDLLAIMNQVSSFKRLLDRVYEGSVMEVVVTNKDRLARFGFELIQWPFKKTDTKLLVLHHQEDHQDPNSPRTEELELAEDLLSIVTVFVAKHHGRRSGESKKEKGSCSRKKRRIKLNRRRNLNYFRRRRRTPTNDPQERNMCN
jgi:predicted site-specific integrase-resolvase